jgi:dihydropteroate synthase
VKIVQAKKPPRFVYDRKGCFKITLDRRRGEIVLYYYPTGSVEPTLAIRGRRPLELYATAIEGGLLSSLSHAAYLGGELERARLALVTGRSYVQDSSDPF